MSEAESVECNPSSWHIAVAAEAFAAAQFARCGFDVSVQYGADQPEYDLIVSKKDHMLKVSVKGSQDGGWGLTQAYLRAAATLSGKKPDYQGAINLWLEKHGSKTVLCLVQFWNVSMDHVPRMYLASAIEVAQQLREAKGGRGEAALNEDWTIKKGPFTGTTEKLPAAWRFSKARVTELLSSPYASR